MKTVNGGLMIILAFFVLWIGVTGRFPALIAAIGLVRGSVPESAPKSGANTQTGTAPSSLPLSAATINPTPSQVLNAPILTVWQNALNTITNPQHGASASY